MVKRVKLEFYIDDGCSRCPCFDNNEYICKATVREDAFGYGRKLEFENLSKMPEWCPLEEMINDNVCTMEFSFVGIREKDIISGCYMREVEINSFEKCLYITKTEIEEKYNCKFVQFVNVRQC